MFENIIRFFKKLGKHEPKETNSKEKAKERLHLVLMQDRANVSADFLEMMKQEIIEVIKKYIEVEENSIDVRLTNEIKEDGTTGAPSLYANIPILHIRNEMKKETGVATENKQETNKENKEESVEDKKEQKEQKEEQKEQNEEQNKENDNSEKIDLSQEEQNAEDKNQEEKNENEQEVENTSPKDGQVVQKVKQTNTI